MTIIMATLTRRMGGGGSIDLIAGRSIGRAVVGTPGALIVVERGIPQHPVGLRGGARWVELNFVLLFSVKITFKKSD